MTANDTAALAAEIRRVQDEALVLAPPSGRVPGFDVGAAYRVARQLRDLRRAAGDVLAGRKIGFTNTTIWPRYGVHQPIWGAMYQRTVFLLPGTDALCRLRGLAEPRIEPEIVFGLRAAPADHSPAALLAAIGWVAHGFEIVQSHCPGWRFQAADTVADGGLHGALFVGPRCPLAALGDDPAAALAGLGLQLRCDGRPVDRGRGANVLGGPLAALGHLVQLLATQADAEPLAAGELVTTGTVTDAWPLAPGQVWTSAIDGVPLPGLRLSCVD